MSAGPIKVLVIADSERDLRRLNSAVPNDFSRDRICSDTDGWAYPSWSAAAVSEPSSYVARKQRS